ncbi:MAG: phenylalanine--tRNA ligase subunit beta, partial [Ruminiclostridium sp.]|nr:phenylalanine--tRNA ligase subunit beta [Ruminiclostridium sp.]
ADIIEEISRIYGYDNFDAHTAISPLYPVQISLEKSVEEQIKDLLVKRYSLHEVHSYVWPYYDDFKLLGIEVEDNIGLMNSSVVIRHSIAPTQFCQIRTNTSYALDFGIFEIGRIADGVDTATNLANEHKKLCITLFSKTQTLEQLYLKLRDMIAVIADDIKHKVVTFKKREQAHSWQHPKNLNTVLCDGKEIGEIGIPYPTITAKIDKKAVIVYAELDIQEFAGITGGSIAYEEPAKYPDVEIDLTLRTAVFSPIGDAIRKVNSPLVKKVSLVDTYDDEEGRALTVRITFLDKKRTLTREEVSSIVDEIIDQLKDMNVFIKE